MCAGSASRRASEIGRLRRRTRTSPSWSSTGTPSEVSHTSLSRPVAPRRRPSSNAASVFSSACARAPRWANAMGGSRREGSRCCTRLDLVRRVTRKWLWVHGGASAPPKDQGESRLVFTVTGGEVIIILVLALIVLGPEKLPDAI